MIRKLSLLINGKVLLNKTNPKTKLLMRNKRYKYPLDGFSKVIQEPLGLGDSFSFLLSGYLPSPKLSLFTRHSFQIFAKTLKGSSVDLRALTKSSTYEKCYNCRIKCRIDMKLGSLTQFCKRNMTLLRNPTMTCDSKI